MESALVDDLKLENIGVYLLILNDTSNIMAIFKNPDVIAYISEFMTKAQNDKVSNISEKPQYSFEILSAENIDERERKANDLPKVGIIVKEKITHSPTTVTYHILGKGGIVKLMKEIESGKK